MVVTVIAMVVTVIAMVVTSNSHGCDKNSQWL